MSKLNRTALFFVITALIGTGVMFLLSCTPKSPIDPTSSIGEGAAVLIDMQALPSSIAVGTSVSTVRIRLLDDSGNPLSKKKINFSTNLGTLSAVSAVTDTSGWAEVRLFAGNETGTARVSASYGKAAASVEVNIISRFEAQIQLTSTRPSILANGIDTTIIKVVVLGDSAKPVAGENVVITPSVGSISYSGTTDDQGIIKAVYTSPARKNDTTAVISAKWDTLATSNVLGLRGVTFVMESSSASILADGSSSTTIKARLKETSTNIAVPDGEVRFGTTLGSIPASAATNSSGVAEVNLTSEKKVGTAQVIGRYGSTLLDTVLVNFTKSTYSVGITASPENPLANGVDKCMITAEVRDASGSAVSGIKVKFSTSLSSMDSVAYTNSSGLAISYIKPVASTENDRTANVSIYVDGVNYSKQVTFAAVQKTVQADPNIIVADGKSTSKITVQLKRKTTQVAIYNADVVFATDKGTIENSAKTDSKGVAEATLKSDNAIGVAHVVVHYGNLPPDTTLITFTGEASGYVLKSISFEQGDYLANGLDQVPVAVKVEDAQGSNAAGVIVSFSTTTTGIIASQAVTDENGLAKINLTAPVNSADVSGQVTAVLGTQSLSTEQINFSGIEYALYASPDSILADGKSMSRITFSLKKTTSHVAVSGAEISFGTTAGAIPNQATTNSQGIAEVNLTSSTTSGVTAVVTASYGTQITLTKNVVFTSEAPSTNILKKLTYTQGSFLANGLDQVAVSARVEDNNGNPVQGEIVLFSATEGAIPSQSMTNSDGEASVMLTAPASITTLSGRVTASLGTQSLVSDDISFSGVTVEISAIPDTIIANGNSTSTIRVVLKRTDDHVAISGAPVTFAADYGTIPNQKNTDSQGVAEVQITSSVEPHTAAVIAQYGPGSVLRQSVNVVFRESTPTYLDISAVPPVIPADGASSSIIKASVSDADHNPVPDGTVVTFSLVGTGTLENRKVTENGVASSTLISGVLPDTVSVNVSVGTLQKSVQVIYQIGDASKVLVSASKDTLKADGQETAQISAKVLDSQGNEVPNVTVVFEASVGNITPSSKTNTEGTAAAQFSSGIVGISTIKASVTNATGGKVYGITTVVLTPGEPNTIRLTYDPKYIGVKETGQNQTTIIYADVRDAKNNPVKDGTKVQFGMVAPDGCTFSSTDSKPTVGGVAQISFTSGIRAGDARIKAVVLDEDNNPIGITAASTMILIHAGPPYIENVNDASTSHLTVFVDRANIWWGLDHSIVTVIVGDKYNNPVEKGTAVYLTTSGGVITTRSYIDANGIATDTLFAAQPYPTIDRYYNYVGMQDPNTGAVLRGPTYYPELGQYLLPNFEQNGPYYPGQVGGLFGDSNGQNNGIARIIAYSEGMDANGGSAKAWCENSVVMSEPILRFHIDDSGLVSTLHPGESDTVIVEIWDQNGNPIASGSKITATINPGDIPATLSWTEITTMKGWGKCFYPLIISNAVNPDKPKEGYVKITVRVESMNGNYSGESKVVYISSN